MSMHTTKLVTLHIMALTLFVGSRLNAGDGLRTPLWALAGALLLPLFATANELFKALGQRVFRD